MNVLGGELEPCSVDPVTGYFRDGYCHTAGSDLGFHVVCAVMTEEFLEFSVSAGNDLVTPQPQWMFPGLRPGDRWCVVAARWQEALEAGVAPPVVLEATHASALEFVSLGDLEANAFEDLGGRFALLAPVALEAAEVVPVRAGALYSSTRSGSTCDMSSARGGDERRLVHSVLDPLAPAAERLAQPGRCGSTSSNTPKWMSARRRARAARSR